MLNALKKEWHEFHSAEAGRRFQERHERRAAHGVVKTVLLVIGGGLIAFGLATLFIPPIPGITLILIGGLMCAQASERAARLCDKCELGIRRGWRRLWG